MIDAFIAFCTSHQDYAWFLALLGWVLAGFVRHRLLRDASAWRWLGPVAWAGAGQAAVELVMLATPVRPVHDAAVHPVGDPILHATTVLALVGAVATWLPRSRWRWALAVPALALVWFHATHRSDANLLTAGLLLAGTFAGVVNLARSGRGAPAFALAGASAALLVSSHGVVADAAGQARDQIEVSRAGLLGGLAAMGAAWSAGYLLARLAWRELRSARWEKRQRDVRQLVRWSAGWICTGLVVASGASWLAQRNYAAAMVARAGTLAGAIDPAALSAALGPEFRLDRIMEPVAQPSGRPTQFGQSDFHASGAVRPLVDRLHRWQALNPDVRQLGIRAVLGPLLVRCLQPVQDPASEKGWVLLERVATPDDLRELREGATGFRGWIDTSYDEIAQARAPVFGPGGRPLAWLVVDTSVSEWMAVQVQARVQGYLAVLLGLGVTVLWFVQRWRDREREEAHRAAESARQADLLKTNFLARVSHDLRTPLQAIAGDGELCLAERLAPEVRRRVEAMLHQTQFLGRMVNDLVDLAAISEGQFSLVPRPLRLPAPLVEAAEGFRARATAKGLELRVVATGPEPLVAGDAARLRQIVGNLVGNAVKFTRRGSVAVEFAVVPLAAERVELTIRVRDTGPGIPAEEQGRLFGAFERGRNAAGIEGLGLGLAIVGGLVKKMGGSVRVESDGHSGSLFEVRVELAVTVAEETAPPPAPDSAVLRGQRILIADDNAHIRRLFAEILARHGAECRTATDGCEALAAFAETDFDAAVCDIAMPGIDGLELARRLRARGVRARLVAVSAHARPEDCATALGAGFDSHFVKPVALDALVALLAEERRPTAPLAALPAGAAPLPIPPELLKRLRVSFRGEVLGEVCEVEALLRLRNWPDLRRKAHYLKNSAFAIDDPTLLAAMGRLEDAAAHQDPGVIEDAWRTARAALEPWLPAPS